MNHTRNTHESDDEEDGDYVPPVTAEESEPSDDEERSAKRARTSSPLPNEDPEEARRARDNLWKQFKESVDSTVKTDESANEAMKMVKIKKTYRFAGEDVVEVVEVPADSADAKKWPLWSPDADQVNNSQAHPESSSKTTVAKVPPPRPGPRKGKVTLSSIPTQKAKKVSTLDKSAMDWKAHVSSANDADDLEANRRGGGYLEKVEFLQRVEDRKDQLLEASKGGKRRRG